MKRFIKYAKPYLPFFIFGPLCMIIEVSGEIILPRLLAKIIDVGIVKGDVKYISTVCALMILTAIIMLVAGIGGSYFAARASVGFATDLRGDVFKKVQSLSFSSIDKFSTGSLVTRLTNDITQIQQFVNMLMRMCLRAPGIFIGSLIVAITINGKLATVLGIIIPLLLISLSVIIYISYPKFSKMQTKIDNLNSNVQENITNVRVVKSFVRQDFEKEKFAESNGNLKKAGLNVMKTMMLTDPIMTIFLGITTAAVVILGGKMIINNSSDISVGDLTSFIAYVTQILFSLMALSMLFVMSSRALASVKRVAEILDEPLTIKDSENADDSKIENGEIEFKGVSFRYYKESPEKVLNDISFKIEAGSTVGIIGSTGCGKSSLISLLPRLYDTDEGEILIDNKDVRSYKLKNLRSAIGIVLQNNTLFSGSVIENLRWGDESATEEEIISAAKASEADKFVKSFTDGYDSILDQGGVNISGGQKQRLCIARALIKKPKILILDDSTSAVDTATEKNIRKAFKNELKGSTKIIIAQRISSVKDADKIIVMNDGRLAAEGTHDYLLKNCEEYREIYASQTDLKIGKEVR